MGVYTDGSSLSVAPEKQKTIEGVCTPMIRGIVEATDKNGEIHKFENGKITEQKKRDTGQVSNGHFFKGWLDSGIETLEDGEISFLIRIMRYVDYTDNTIRLNGEVMTVKEMSVALGKEYTRLSRMVNGLVEKKVMGKHSTEIVQYAGRRKTVYSVNPYILCRGRMLNLKVRDYYGNG